MASYSKASFGFIVLGIVFFSVNWFTTDYFEPIVLIGVICLLAGAVLSFVAIVRNENGGLKFISLFSFFILLFLITWIEPFQLIRMITWLKNMI